MNNDIIINELKAGTEDSREALMNLMIQYFSNQTIREKFFFLSFKEISFLNIAKILSANTDLFLAHDRKWHEKVIKFLKIGYQKGYLKFDKLTENYLLEFTDCEMLEWQNESTLLNYSNITATSSKYKTIASDEGNYMEDIRTNDINIFHQLEAPLELNIAAV